MTSSPRRRGLRSHVIRAGALLGAVALLAGCGAVRPGVAAQVGDQSITVAEVDAAAVAFCVAYGTANPGGVVPMRIARDFLLVSMIEQSIGDQLATEYDVSPGVAYEQAVSQAKAQISGLPDDQRDAVLGQQVAAPYRQAVTQAAAEALLAQDGVASPTPKQLQGRTSLLETQWADSNDVVVDPRFSVEVVDGKLTDSQTGSLGFPVSESAKVGLQTDPQALGTHAQSLPPSQRCGA